ncbi:hypothetical protein IW262DRAFT_1528175 [Armillaria fumosa]|nr:hypothetical protein IW262DRAFT_1528175 [Armillaria fumosa]
MSLTLSPQHPLQGYFSSLIELQFYLLQRYLMWRGLKRHSKDFQKDRLVVISIARRLFSVLGGGACFDTFFLRGGSEFRVSLVSVIFARYCGRSQTLKVLYPQSAKLALEMPRFIEFRELDLRLDSHCPAGALERIFAEIWRRVILFVVLQGCSVLIHAMRSSGVHVCATTGLATLAMWLLLTLNSRRGPHGCFSIIKWSRAVIPSLAAAWHLSWRGTIVLEEGRATIVAHIAIHNMCRQSLSAANTYANMTAAHAHVVIREGYYIFIRSHVAEKVRYGGSSPLGQAIWSIAADPSTIMCPFRRPMRPDRVRISILGHPAMH